MNDRDNHYEGPSDGDYASYVNRLGASGDGRQQDGGPDRQPATGVRQAAAGPQAGPAGAAGDDQPTHGAAEAASAAQQTAAPPSRAPRFIGLLLIIAAWVSFFVALRLGIQAWNARSGHMDEWLPAGFALIAARLLLAMGKAARNPRVPPQDPKKTFPEHIEY